MEGKSALGAQAEGLEVGSASPEPYNKNEIYSANSLSTDSSFAMPSETTQAPGSPETAPGSDSIFEDSVSKRGDASSLPARRSEGERRASEAQPASRAPSEEGRNGKKGASEEDTLISLERQMRKKVESRRERIDESRKDAASLAREGRKKLKKLVFALREEAEAERAYGPSSLKKAATIIEHAGREFERSEKTFKDVAESERELGDKVLGVEEVFAERISGKEAHRGERPEPGASLPSATRENGKSARSREEEEPSFPSENPLGGDFAAEKPSPEGRPFSEASGEEVFGKGASHSPPPVFDSPPPQEEEEQGRRRPLAAGSESPLGGRASAPVGEPKELRWVRTQRNVCAALSFLLAALVGYLLYLG